MRMTAGDWTLLLFLSVLWGGAFFFVGVAISEIPPLTLVILRTGIAAMALAALLRARGVAWPFAGAALAPFFVMGLLNNLIPFSLLFWAQTTISSGLASILNATTPIFAIVVAHFALADERMAAHKLAGIVLGFLGVAVLLGSDALAGGGAAAPGMVACLVAPRSFGLAGVVGRRFKAMGLSALQVACGQLCATTVMMGPLVAVFDAPWQLPPPGAGVVAAVLALALASTALAYVIYFRLLATAGAVNATLVTLLIPASAILLGALFLGERLTSHHYAGMALIGAGLLAIDGRLLAQRRGAAG